MRKPLIGVALLTCLAGCGCTTTHQYGDLTVSRHHFELMFTLDHATLPDVPIGRRGDYVFHIEHPGGFPWHTKLYVLSHSVRHESSFVKAKRRPGFQFELQVIFRSPEGEELTSVTLRGDEMLSSPAGREPDDPEDVQGFSFDVPISVHDDEFTNRTIVFRVITPSPHPDDMARLHWSLWP